MLRILNIEDEKLQAADLADTLKNIDNDIDILSILGTVKQAVAFFKTKPKVDIIFSDIQLPDGLSFEIFNIIQIPAPVIFCTAFDQYALHAFQANGIDYLLKPFSKVTVSKALDKYQSLKVKFSSPDIDFQRLTQLLMTPQPNRSVSIMVNQGDKIIPIVIENIALFYIEDDYSFALTFELKKYILEHTLEELEKMSGSQFFRVNRQYLVNRQAVRDVSRYFNRKLLINLKINFPEQILVGKLKASAFIDWLANN